VFVLLFAGGWLSYHFIHKQSAPSNQSSSGSSNGSETKQAPAVTPGLPPVPSGAFDVVKYGADPTGQKDSTVAIRNAIAAAEAASGNGHFQTVYFPAGKYILDDNDARTVDFQISTGRVNFLGAGRSDTDIVEEVGTYKYPSLKRGKTVFIFGKADSGFYFSGITVDCQTYNGGDTLDNYGGYATIEHDEFLGGYNGKGQISDNNIDDFDMRDVAVCHRTATGVIYGYSIGNVVDDVILNGKGVGGNADLDITCQEDITITDIVDTGWGVALYSDKNATVTNYSYTPQVLSPGAAAVCQVYGCDFGYYVTTGYNVTINDFVTTGAGGVISGQGAKSTSDRPSNGVVINGEQMKTPGFYLEILNALNVKIRSSLVDRVKIHPPAPISGIDFLSSRIGAVQCGGKFAITDLVGAKCQAAS
jgi:acetyltransferase-like isoleucine patch superfamily enzyme